MPDIDSIMGENTYAHTFLQKQRQHTGTCDEVWPSALALLPRVPALAPGKECWILSSALPIF